MKTNSLALFINRNTVDETSAFIIINRNEDNDKLLKILFCITGWGGGRGRENQANDPN